MLYEVITKENILQWLGDIKNIYYHQESYSKAIEALALDKQVPFVDLRGAFLKSGDVNALLCEDGTHPNTAGQKVIASTFYNFANGFLYGNSKILMPAV